MLTWTKRSEAWFGNGYRIDRESPQRWVLVENLRTDDSLLVVTEPTPLATTESLTACKFEAEILHRSATLARQRRLLMGVLLGTGALGVFGAAYPLVLIGAIIIGAATALELVMTWYEPITGNVRDSIQ